MPDSIIKADNISSLSGGGIGFPDGSVSQPSMKFTNDTDTGLYRIGSNTIGLSTNGTEKLRIDNTGNVTLSNGILNSNGRSILNQSGSILQVLQNSIAGGSNTTSTSYQDVTNFTVSITPSSTSSRILVIASALLSNTVVASTNIIYYQRLVGNGVELQVNYISAESVSGGLQAKGNLSISCIHSPSTISPITYKIQHYITTSSSTGSCSSGFIIAMEISG
jgi:hypothetical protein